MRDIVPVLLAASLIVISIGIAMAAATDNSNNISACGRVCGDRGVHSVTADRCVCELP